MYFQPKPATHETRHDQSRVKKNFHAPPPQTLPLTEVSNPNNCLTGDGDDGGWGRHGDPERAEHGILLVRMSAGGELRSCQTSELALATRTR
ncbi:hypothetical protein E4U21_003968 [Claviceps maximensis]|nr:hypothetical protein E4U21_003968 [Claviceps maximensis]